MELVTYDAGMIAQLVDTKIQERFPRVKVSETTPEQVMDLIVAEYRALNPRKLGRDHLRRVRGRWDGAPFGKNANITISLLEPRDTFDQNVVRDPAQRQLLQDVGVSELSEQSGGRLLFRVLEGIPLDPFFAAVRSVFPGRDFDHWV